MEKPHEPIIGAVERAADKRSDVRRSDQSVPRNCTHDLHVIIGKPEWRRLDSAPKSGSSCRRDSGSDIHMQQFYHALSRGLSWIVEAGRCDWRRPKRQPVSRSCSALLVEKGEERRFEVAPGRCSIGERSPVLVQLEQRELNRVRAGLLLLAPKLQHVPPQEALAVDLDEFRIAHVCFLRA